ncbi:MAG: hypothetical protein U0Q07_02360 [Acidimicrobiales bacterium]
MGRDDSVHATRRWRLAAAGLGFGLLVAVGCTTKSSTGSPKPTPPTPGQFAPSSFVPPSPPTISVPTYGPTSTRGRTIG